MARTKSSEKGKRAAKRFGFSKENLLVEEKSSLREIIIKELNAGGITEENAKKLKKQREEAKANLSFFGTLAVNFLLNEALKKKDLEGCVYALMRGASLNERVGNSTMTPLHWAANSGDEKIVEVLVAAGADPNERGGAEDITPLYGAALKRHANVVKTLAKLGAEVDAKDRAGNTALMILAKRGDEEMVRVLLDVGANPHIKGKNNKSAFELAKTKEIVDILNETLEKG